MQLDGRAQEDPYSSPHPEREEEEKEDKKKRKQTCVPLHGICGFAPGCIPAYSNGTSSTFTNRAHYKQRYFMGYKWQCVEFARRWLFYRKGLVLPQFDFAAHLLHLRRVYDVHTKAVVPCRVIPQGGTEPPVLDSLIVYPGSYRNIVGHVGVITHMTCCSVGVADQNRYFHDWAEKPFSAEFALDCVNGRYYVRDPELECRGWIVFPQASNQIDTSILQEGEEEREEYLYGPPSLGYCVRLSYMLEHLWAWCTGRDSITFYAGKNG